MTPGGRKPDDGDRYKAILETAARLICERGYEGTSMQEIAAACRMTKAGLYHHIQNKEQLLFAIMSYGMDLFEEPGAREGAGHRGPGGAAALVHAPQHRAGDARVRARRSSSSSTSTPRSPARRASTSISARSSYVRFLENSFAEAVKQGRIRAVDPTIAAFSFLGMVLWVYKWFKPDGRLTGRADHRRHGGSALRGPRRPGGRGPSSGLRSGALAGAGVPTAAGGRSRERGTLAPAVRGGGLHPGRRVAGHRGLHARPRAHGAGAGADCPGQARACSSSRCPTRCPPSSWWPAGAWRGWSCPSAR